MLADETVHQPGAATVIVFQRVAIADTGSIDRKNDKRCDGIRMYEACVYTERGLLYCTYDPQEGNLEHLPDALNVGIPPVLLFRRQTQPTSYAGLDEKPNDEC